MTVSLLMMKKMKLDYQLVYVNKGSDAGFTVDTDNLEIINLFPKDKDAYLYATKDMLKEEFHISIKTFSSVKTESFLKESKTS